MTESNPEQICNLDRIVSEVRQMAVIDSPGARRLLARIPPQAIHKTLWRRLLSRRRVISITALALVILGISWVFRNPLTPVAIAQVIEATTKHRVVRYTVRSYEVGNDKPLRQDVCHHDLQYPRFRFDVREKGGHDVVMVIDNQADRCLILSHKPESGDQLKKGYAILMRVPDVKVFPFACIDKSLLEILRTLQQDKATISSDDFNGGIRTTRYTLRKDEGISSVWVDKTTKLPIRIEFELTTAEMGEERKKVKETDESKWVCTEFIWDVDIDKPDEYFSTEPPVGYLVESEL